MVLDNPRNSFRFSRFQLLCSEIVIKMIQILHVKPVRNPKKGSRTGHWRGSFMYYISWACAGSALCYFTQLFVYCNAHVRPA